VDPVDIAPRNGTQSFRVAETLTWSEIAERVAGFRQSFAGFACGRKALRSRRSHPVPRWLGTTAHPTSHVALNVSNKIVGMQALHDDDNRPLFLAVEATAQGVVKPLIHGPAAGFGQGVVRL
jgi:hypothetical protein